MLVVNFRPCIVFQLFVVVCFDLAFIAHTTAFKVCTTLGKNEIALKVHF